MTNNRTNRRTRGAMRLLAATALTILISASASCSTQKKATDTNVVEAVMNRVMYDHSMETLGSVKSSTSVRDVNALAIIGRKIVVYDTSHAVRDSVTGEWSAPVLYTIEENGKTESETKEQRTTVEQDTLTSTHEVICVTDSTGYERHETTIEKKKELLGWRTRLWAVIILCLAIALVLLWKYARTLKI